MSLIGPTQRGPGKLLPDKLAGPLEGAAGRGWTAVKGMFGGGGGVEAGPGAGAADGATAGTGGAPGSTAGEPAEPLLPGGRTQAEVDRANAEFEEMKQGWRRGDDLPGRGPWGPAQSLLDAMMGRARLTPARAGAGAGGASGGRPTFDEGGGVFSPKKGGNVLQMAADDAAGGGTGGNGEIGGSGPRLKPSGEFEDPALEAKYQKYAHDNPARGRRVRDRLDWKRESDNWANGPVARGNDFNRTVNTRGDYPYSEVYLKNGKFVDGYRPPEGTTPGEIVSRKAIDFNGYSEGSFRGHLSEFNAKYQPGTEIASGKYPQLNGETLSGRKILEVPETNRTSTNSQRFEEIAQEYGIEIRYTPEH